MNRRIMAAVIIPAAVAAAGAGGLALWQRLSEPPVVSQRLPGTDGAEAAMASGVVVAVRGELTRGDGQPSTRPGDWPQFRGPQRDGVARGISGWADAWPTNGPRVVWQIPVGEGHAGPAVWRGRVYLVDYERDRHRDAIRCLSLDDGRELWRYAYRVDIKRNHGMSRTVSAVTDGLLVALGPKCHVTALDPVSGEKLWTLDLVREYGATVPPWYAGQCPLIDGGRVILAPGGTALLMAVDGATGSVIWSLPNPNEWKMTHSSIIAAELGGRRQYVYCASQGVVGVAADDGTLLWSTTEWKIGIANVPTPVALGGDRLLLTGGYNAGAALLEVTRGETGFAARVVRRLPAQTFGADQQTPILHKGHVYGVRPGGELACLTTEGQVRWTSGAGKRFGIGPFVIAGERLLVMNDAGRLTLVKVNAEAYEPLAEAQVLAGHDSWGPLAVTEDFVLARDLTTLVCLDMRGEGGLEL